MYFTCVQRRCLCVCTGVRLFIGVFCEVHVLMHDRELCASDVRAC